MNPQPFEALAERMTLAHLADMTGLTVEEILSRVVLDIPRPVRAKPEKQETRAPVRRVVPSRAQPIPSAPLQKNGEVDTRSKKGREAYDAAVSQYLQKSGKPAGATEVRKAIGGTPEQFRASVNRLIDDGMVGYEGQARSTRYYWVKD